MGGQIIDATVVPAPKQRNTQEEKAAIKEGRIPEGWKPAKTRQKDRDARWSIKYTKAKVREGADPKAAKPVDLAIPMFGYPAAQFVSGRVIGNLGSLLRAFGDANPWEQLMLLTTPLEGFGPNPETLLQTLFRRDDPDTLRQLTGLIAGWMA